MDNMATGPEDTTKLLVQLLRSPDHQRYTKYGYEIYLPGLLYTYFEKKGIPNIQEMIRQKSPAFYNAAWELCRRGILRPGVKWHGAQATAEGASGDGYSITPFGHVWLEESDHDDFVPTEPERYGEMLAKYRNRFGPGYHERAQQAIRCYGAHAYLACCVMCGAGAESIILATAIRKHGNETELLKQYASANGRHKIESILIGKSRKSLQDDYRAHSALLKYWRDEAAHGRVSGIGDNEGYTSLALLLRLVMFIDGNWDELTSPDR